MAAVGEERKRVLGEKVVRVGRRAVLPLYRALEAMHGKMLACEMIATQRAE